MGHEVGHALAEQVPFPAPALPAHLEAYPARGITAKWQQELLSDAWAVFLLGPAPLLSLIEISAHQHLASETHPCNHLRFALMANCLRNSGFLAAEDAQVCLGWLQEHVDNAIGEAEEFQPTIVPDAAFPAFASVHEYLSAKLAAIGDFVLNRPGKYDRTVWASGMPQGDDRHSLVTRILHCTPPDSVQGSAELPHLGSILNAGWAVHRDPDTWQEFSSQFDCTEADREYEALKRLNQLLLKAIESTSLKREWSQ